MSNNKNAINKQIPFPGWFDKEDECITCVHQHENWGDNKYCKQCRKQNDDKYKNI